MAEVAASTQDGSCITHFRRPVQGVDTEFVVCSGYDDRVVAMVMQTGRLGTVLLASLSGGGSRGPFGGMAMAMAATGEAGFGGAGGFADSDLDGWSDAEPRSAPSSAAQLPVAAESDGTASDGDADESPFDPHIAAAAPVPCNVSVLLGRRDEPLLEACARRVVGALSGRGMTKPLLLTVQMQQHTMEALREVADVLVEQIAAQTGVSAA